MSLGCQRPRLRPPESRGRVHPLLKSSLLPQAEFALYPNFEYVRHVTAYDLALTSPFSMGAMKWRAQEILLLETAAESTEGKKLMKMALQKGDGQGKSYWFRNATHYFVMKYKEELSACFEDETRVEFAFRKRCQPRAKLQPYMKETEAERDERLKSVNTVRILASPACTSFEA